MYLMVLSIRTKYVLNFYVSINIFTGISLRISKLPRIISRARILISHSWAWDIQTRCRLQLSQISLMVWFQLLSPASKLTIRGKTTLFTSFQQQSFAQIVSCDRYIDDWSSLFALFINQSYAVMSRCCVVNTIISCTVFINKSSNLLWLIKQVSWTVLVQTSENYSVHFVRLDNYPLLYIYIVLHCNYILNSLAEFNPII